MKKTILVLALGSSSAVLTLAEEPKTPAPNIPPPVSYVQSAPAGGQTYVYEQRPVAGRPVLIAPEQAQNLINRFKTNYPKLGSPKLVMVVNRDLVDESSGLRLAGRTERVQSNSTEVKGEFKADPNAPVASPSTSVPPGSNVTIVGDVNGNRNRIPGAENVNTRTDKTTVENTYKNTERTGATLADKQTVRDVERLFGRPLRMAGASLADQRVATQLMSDRPVKAQGGEGEQARKDREALAKIADVAIEVLISSRPITVSELSGDRVYQVPDIQATAVRLNDSQILGQATSSDIIGKDRYAGNIVRNFDVREIAEATALALMEDMMLGIE